MRRAAGVCIGLAAVLLTLGYAGGGYRIGAAASAIIGSLWLIGLYRGWAGMGTLGLIGLVGMAAAGASVVALPMLLAGVAAALAAWDLQRFTRRLDDGGQVLHEPALVRSHIRWSLGAVGAGLLIGLIAPAVHIPLRFGWAILLSALAVFGVSRAIRWLNRPS
jgi:hypothetical protein